MKLYTEVVYSGAHFARGVESVVVSISGVSRLRDELSATEAKLRSLPTRNENACVVNGHGDGLLGWEDGECVP